MKYLLLLLALTGCTTDYVGTCFIDGNNLRKVVAQGKYSLYVETLIGEKTDAIITIAGFENVAKADCSFAARIKPKVRRSK